MISMSKTPTSINMLFAINESTKSSKSKMVLLIVIKLGWSPKDLIKRMVLISRKPLARSSNPQLFGLYLHWLSNLIGLSANLTSQMCFFMVCYWRRFTWSNLMDLLTLDFLIMFVSLWTQASPSGLVYDIIFHSS